MTGNGTSTAQPAPVKRVAAKPRRTPSKERAVVPKTAAASGAETRLRIIEAARDVLAESGITEASARNIARRGDFNQALIFYHFGSLDGLLIAVADEEGRKRADLYAEQFQRISKLSELVRIARDVHQEEMNKGGATVLSQLLAGALSSAPIATGMVDAMKPWMALVESAMGQTAADTPLAQLLPKQELAFAVASLFIGMELLSSLDPSSKQAEQLFDVFNNLAVLADLVLANPSILASLPGPHT
jgi:AcrR family transcriptional regulator